MFKATIYKINQEGVIVGWQEMSDGYEVSRMYGHVSRELLRVVNYKYCPAVKVLMGREYVISQMAACNIHIMDMQDMSVVAQFWQGMKEFFRPDEGLVWVIEYHSY